MFNFSEIFPKPAKPHRRVQILNPIVVKLSDGTARHCDAGEIVEVTHKDALGLDTGDFVFLDKTTAAPIPLATMPVRPEPEPLPARWAELPPCFASWWDLSQKFIVARKHRQLIVEKRIDVFGTHNSLGNPAGDVGTLISTQIISANKGQGVHTSRREIRLDSPEVIAQERGFQRAEQAALDHLDELKKTYGLKIQKLHLACGQARLDSVEKLTAITQEIRAIGYELFSMRVAALELHPNQVAKLYAGSALFAKYAVHHDPYVSGTCFAGYDASGNLRTYVEDEVESIAGGMIYDADRSAQLSPILAEARAELAKATKAAA